jgi:hypothetical protein
MQNYWIQALLYRDCRNDYRYDNDTTWQPWLICDSVIKQMLKGRAPQYIKLTISTQPLENGKAWQLLPGHLGYWVKNLKTGQHRLIFSEMENWLLTLDSDTFYVTVEAVKAADYRKGL